MDQRLQIDGFGQRVKLECCKQRLKMGMFQMDSENSIGCFVQRVSKYIGCLRFRVMINCFCQRVGIDCLGFRVTMGCFG